MAKSDSPQDSSSASSSASSKKVAKAAKAGATPQATAGREQRSLGFPMAFTAIVVLGIALVAFSWNARDVEALSPSFGDHWHLSFGVYDCRQGDFIAPLQDPQLPNSGIHTHSDGVIHLHPASSTATGNGATVERFFEALQETISDEEISSPNINAVTEEGATCDGEPAILHSARFAPGSDEPVEVLTEDISSLRFRNDQEGIVIALVPAGADIPPPPPEAVEGAAASSPGILRTDGLNDLAPIIDGSHGGDDTVNVGGFNDDGILVDGEGNPVLDPDGNEITRVGLEADLAEVDGDSDE